MMCEERTAVSLFGVAVFFFVWWDELHRLLFSILCCGGWNEPYAGDVAAVRAGLRRRILLRLRKSAKNIETGAELASGSDSSPCLNNADSRSLSSITPPPQQPIPLPHPRLKIQPQRAENRSECTSCPVPKKTQYIKKNRHSVPHPIPKHTETRSAQRLTSNTQAYTNRSHNIPHSSKATDRNHPRHSVPHPTPKHTGTSQHPPLLHNQELLKKSPRGVQRGRGFAAPLRFSFCTKKIAPTSQRCKS